MGMKNIFLYKWMDPEEWAENLVNKINSLWIEKEKKNRKWEMNLKSISDENERPNEAKSAITLNVYFCIENIINEKYMKWMHFENKYQTYLRVKRENN